MPQPSSHTLRRVLEGALLLVGLFYAIRWVLNPQGPFEPTVALCSITLAALDYWFRRSPTASDNTATGQATSIPEAVLRTSPQSKEDVDVPPFRSSSSADFFAERFSAAFPGLRTTQWFSGRQATERLAVLLAHPLGFKTTNDSIIHPIWWFRDGNSQVRSFSVLDSTTVLLDEKELSISKIAAVFSTSYKRLFVYVECAPMQPCGLYVWSPQDISRSLDDFGYAWEEYGLYKGTHRVTRREYDDRATVILGKVVQMNSELTLRVRYITPYNFVLTSHGSPINENSFDLELEEHLNAINKDADKLSALIERVQQLPMRRVSE